MKFSQYEYLPKEYDKPCTWCGRIYRAITAKVCQGCRLANLLYRQHGSGREQAVKAVNREIKYGRLPRPTEFVCVDCGDPAQIYEHRDYDKPLDVVPACRSCNGKRGYAIPLRMSFDQFIAIVSRTTAWARNEMTVADFEPIRRKYFKESPCA